ncbi:phosphoglycerate dehydrogenase [bacterium]|nr:MAG: phosphoglycerate dehydrogenase [bacterium]
MKVLLADAVSAECGRLLEDAGHEVIDRPGQARADLQSTLANCEGLVVRSATTVDAALMDAAPELQVIGRAGSGVDNIDVEAATARGIIVMNAPGENTLSAAEHAWAMLMAISRNVVRGHDSMVQGQWSKKGLMGVELHSKTLGVLGLGRIGREVATRAKAFGMTVLVYDPFLPSGAAEAIGVELCELDAIWPRADFLTVHAPLTDKTHHLVDARALSLCKDGVRVVNCARGGLVDEAALLDALDSGRVAGAALDVFEQEPLPADSPLRSHAGLVLTPHLGASTSEAQDKVAIRIAEQFNDYFARDLVRNAVNMIALEPQVAERLAPWQKLAETIGLVHAEVMDGQFGEVEVSISGEIRELPLRAFTSAVLKGFLSVLLSERINLVNAEAVARSRGFEVREVRGNETDGYSGLLTVRLRSAEAEHVIEGAVFGVNHPKIVRVDDFYVETDARGDVLFVQNDDVPGRLAAVAAVIAKYDVNIADFALGRNRESGQAMNAVHLDNPLGESALQEVRDVQGVHWARLVRMPR